VLILFGISFACFMLGKYAIEAIPRVNIVIVKACSHGSVSRGFKCHLHFHLGNSSG